MIIEEVDIVDAPFFQPEGYPVIGPRPNSRVTSRQIGQRVRSRPESSPEPFETATRGMPRNRRVRIDRKRGKDAWITVTPFDPLPEAPNLTAVKAETVAT